MQNSLWLLRGALPLAASLPFLVASCASSPDVPSEAETSSESETTATETAAESTGGGAEAGQLEIRANGEDFVRQGFETRDGWQVSFDQVYVTLAAVTAYQSNPTFDAGKGGKPEAETIVKLDGPVTVDLAAGDENAEPVLVKTLEAPAGRYNALSWEMVPAAEGPAQGYPLVLIGQATKAAKTVGFTLQIDQPLSFVCGDFVGDERKGILAANETADIEATFHFDHLFGDGGAPADDAINTGALGFDPLAALAQEGELVANMATLESGLSPVEYQTLMEMLPSLGHVGEGHCDETELTS